MSNDEQEPLKSDRILEKQPHKANRSQQVQVDEDTVQVVVVTLDNSSYALPSEKIFEIGENRKLYPIPGTPAYVLGIQNLRGDVASILSIKVLMRLSDRDEGTGKRVVYCMFQDNLIGFLVDSVEDVIDYPLSGIKEPLSTLDKLRKEFIHGEILYREQHIPYLNPESIYERAYQGINSGQHS